MTGHASEGLLVPPTPFIGREVELAELEGLLKASRLLTLDMVFVRKADRAFAVTSPSLANLVGDPQASKSAMVDMAKIVLGQF